MKKSLLLINLMLLSLLITVKAQTGADCNTSITASIGSTTGNGNYSQFYKFTASATGYINLYSSSTSYCYTYVSKGACNSLSQVVSGNSSKGSPLLLYVESGSTYTISTYNLYSNNLVIESTNVIGKEITDSYVYVGSDYFYAHVDTINNTLTYTVPDDADLTSVTYSFSRLNYNYTSLSVNGSAIQSYGSINLSTLSSLVINGNDGSKATYTVTVIKKSGISCSTATPLVEDKIKGNGENIQYYSFAPATTGYYKLKTNQNGYYIYTYKGNCGSLAEINSDNIYTNRSLILYGEAATTYIIKTEGQKNDSLIKEKITQLPKEFTSFYVYRNSNYYYGEIDTVKNKISIEIPSDFDLVNVSYSYGKTGYNYTTVSANEKTIPTNGSMDFSDTNTFDIAASDGTKATYTITFEKVEGLSCTTAKVITEKTTLSNGKYMQYFSYTPADTKYIKIYPSGSSMFAYLYTGNCDGLSVQTTDNFSRNSPLEMKAIAGTKYTLRIYNLENNKLIIDDLTSITKEFRDFTIQRGSDYYNANIDTVKNTITISVPSDLDLTAAEYSFSKANLNLTTVTANGTKLENSGTTDFSAISSLIITADDGTTQTYALTIKKVEGMSCGTAVIANYGLNDGNGVNNTYFTFTPNENGYVSMYPSVSNSYIEILKGTCDGLTSVVAQYAYVNSPLIMGCESGKTYTIKANYLNSNSLVIKKIKSISKEFSYFQLSDNANSYNAVVDTIDNTLTLTVPSEIDLSNLNYYFNITSNNSAFVSLNDVQISSNGTMDFTSVSSFTIEAKDGSSAVYTLKFNKDNSLNCSTSTEITEGTITGNGKYMQYFTYTPAKAGYVKFSSDKEFQIVVNKGECGSLVEEGSDWVEPEQDFILPVDAGVKYTILSKDQASDKFTLTFLDHMSLDFSSFYLRDDYNNGYSSEVDTVLNKIMIKVPAGFDKSNVITYYEFVGNRDLTVTANDVALENQNYTDFTNISTLKLVDENNASVTYSVVFTETAGASCETATTISEGTTKGNGATTQYFAFTPSKSGYIKISTLDKYFYLTVREGSCDYFKAMGNDYIEPGYSQSYKVELGKNYIFSANYLMENSFSFSYVNTISKELSTARLSDGTAMYYGTVDTVANTIKFTVSAGLDLSLVNYYFGLKDENNTYVIAKGDSISYSGVNDFSNLNSITIKATDGTTATYSVSFKTSNVALYYFNAGCGEHGSISPNGSMSVEKGSNVVYTITPNHGYAVKELYIDDEPVTIANSYTFSNVTGQHTIYANFEQTMDVKPVTDVRINLYPNPFRNNLTVESIPGSILKVFNNQGARMYESIMESSSKTIDLSVFPQGLYIVEIQHGEKVERFKAIKQ